MPQLVKGGKYVFGWSTVGVDGAIVIPPEAYTEYHFQDVPQGILLSASRTSGGFLLGSVTTLRQTVLAKVLDEYPELERFQIPEGEPITYKQRTCCWVTLHGNRFTVPIATLQRYGITPGGRVLAVRGSYVALSFIVRGPILAEAGKHADIPLFP